MAYIVLSGRPARPGRGITGVSLGTLVGEQLSWVEGIAMVCVIVASVGSTRALSRAPVVNE